MSFFEEHHLIYSCKCCFSLNILCYINRKVNKLMSHDSSSDIFSDSWLWLWGINMLSTLQFQSAHSAGSTYWSTAVCALQVLLVYPSLLISQFTHEDGILVGLQQVLLVCSQLLPVCAVQIHAKLSVSQAGSQKKRGVHVKLFKKAFSLQTAEQMSPPTPSPPADAMLRQLNVVSLNLPFVSLFSGGWRHNFGTWRNEKKLHSIHLQSARCCEQLHKVLHVLVLFVLMNLGELLLLAAVWCSVNTRCHHLYVIGCVELSRSNWNCQLKIRKSVWTQSPILC